MNDTIKRMARAIILSAPAVLTPEQVRDAEIGHWPIWYQAVDQARAGLRAAREPTDAMVEGAMPWADAAGAIETWRAMVDVALGKTNG